MTCTMDAKVKETFTQNHVIALLRVAPGALPGLVHLGYDSGIGPHYLSNQIRKIRGCAVLLPSASQIPLVDPRTASTLAFAHWRALSQRLFFARHPLRYFQLFWFCTFCDQRRQHLHRRRLPFQKLNC